eukprot:2263238-Rhodomonas_salina.1
MKIRIGCSTNAAMQISGYNGTKASMQVRVGRKQTHLAKLFVVDGTSAGIIIAPRQYSLGMAMHGG